MGKQKQLPPHEQLRHRLVELGWSQADLGEAIGVSAAFASRLVAGKRRPSLDVAFRIQESRVGLPATIWRESSPGLRAPKPDAA